MTSHLVFVCCMNDLGQLSPHAGLGAAQGLECHFSCLFFENTERYNYSTVYVCMIQNIVKGTRQSHDYWLVAVCSSSSSILGAR